MLSNCALRSLLTSRKSYRYEEERASRRNSIPSREVVATKLLCGAVLTALASPTKLDMAKLDSALANIRRRSRPRASIRLQGAEDVSLVCSVIYRGAHRWFADLIRLAPFLIPSFEIGHGSHLGPSVHSWSPFLDHFPSPHPYELLR